MEINTCVVAAAWLLSAYLIGGIPFGYLIGRMRGIDVRTVGSKNIGATNVFRTVGKKWGLLAFALDVAKGLVPTLLAKSFAPAACLPLVVGVTCVVGHMLTPYMKFKGGKGVATAFGMLIGLVPALVGVAFLVFVAAFALSNYISLGSCLAAAFLAVSVWFPWLGVKGVADLPQCILVTAIALFVIWKHRSNIKRLIEGTENKIYIFKKQK
ncbi:MAG: glycerol-3-phosphate 1-O-acyltransferase PlsY [Kiritimatiellae bacterium]|nr:glycerol-3-phosphate 1-O-acyltransferase PlsY [Kiritimatiellia bacterium]